MSPETPLEPPYNLSGQMGIEFEEGGPLQTYREAPNATKTPHMATTGPLKQDCPLRSQALPFSSPALLTPCV